MQQRKPMKGGGFRPLVNTTQYPVIIQTMHNRIHGNLHTRENERIKDALNSNELFIAITGAVIFDVDGLKELKRSDFLAINRQHVIWIIENQPPTGSLNS